MKHAEAMANEQEARHKNEEDRKALQRTNASLQARRPALRPS